MDAQQLKFACVLGNSTAENGTLFATVKRENCATRSVMFGGKQPLSLNSDERIEFRRVCCGSVCVTFLSKSKSTKDTQDS